MRITIKGTNIEHTNAIDAYLTKRLRDLEKLLEPKEASALARVDLGLETKRHKQGKVFYAEITFHLKGHDFRVVARGEDLYEAIDAMRDEIVREVKRFHGRGRSAKREGAREGKRRLRGV